MAGASGYAGGELARLIAQHPDFELGALTAHRNEGRAVSEVHPHLRSLGQAFFRPTQVAEFAGHDVIVLALPHGQSGQLGEELTASYPEATIVDLGADRRLHSEAEWTRYYGGAHWTPWEYGIPELPLAAGGVQRDRLRGAKRIVAPGCNASAVSIALAPLVRNSLIDEGTIVSMLSVGTSGAGRTLREDLLASERFSSATAYALAGSHRHTPEVVQTLVQAGADQSRMSLSLTPVLVPMSRGIIAVNTVSLRTGVDATALREALSESYAGEAFVEIYPEGSSPSTGSVLGSNTVALSVAVDHTTNRATLVSVLDNLVKGTAGAAIQSLNVALGLPEQRGLPVDGVAP